MLTIHCAACRAYALRPGIGTPRDAIDLTPNRSVVLTPEISRAAVCHLRSSFSSSSTSSHRAGIASAPRLGRWSYAPHTVMPLSCAEVLDRSNKLGLQRHGWDLLWIVAVPGLRNCACPRNAALGRPRQLSTRTSRRVALSSTSRARRRSEPANDKILRVSLAWPLRSAPRVTAWRKWLQSSPAKWRRYRREKEEH